MVAQHLGPPVNLPIEEEAPSDEGPPSGEELSGSETTTVKIDLKEKAPNPTTQSEGQT